MKQVTNDIEKVVCHRPHIKYHLGVVIYDQSCILLGLSLIKTPMKMDYQQGPLLIGTNHWHTSTLALKISSYLD